MWLSKSLLLAESICVRRFSRNSVGTSDMDWSLIYCLWAFGVSRCVSVIVDSRLRMSLLLTDNICIRRFSRDFTGTLYPFFLSFSDLMNLVIAARSLVPFNCFFFQFNNFISQNSYKHVMENTKYLYLQWGWVSTIRCSIRLDIH